MRSRILAVDDEHDVLMIIRTALQGEGFEVETADNGRDCISMATENPPDLIILDVMMPEMSGFEVVKELKANEKTEAVPIIMLTGVSERARIQEALISGIDYYIIKPFEFNDLIAKVDQALQGFDA